MSSILEHGADFSNDLRQLVSGPKVAYNFTIFPNSLTIFGADLPRWRMREPAE